MLGISFSNPVACSAVVVSWQCLSDHLPLPACVAASVHAILTPRSSQVDSGLSLKFESGARSNKHVFDLKTSKRVYYLATKTEEEMNKWVACICSVCGLKMREEEPENGSRGNRYSPQPSAEKSPTPSPHVFASVSATSSTRTAQHAGSPGSNHRINNNSLDVVALNYSVPRATNGAAKEPREGVEGSGPYIPISECHTGKPAATPATSKENRPSNQPTTQATTLASSGSNRCKSNLAVPLASKTGKATSHVLLADEFYDVPRSSASRPAADWDTFPKDDKNRASSRSCSASFEAKSSRTTAGLGSRIRCESGPGDGEVGAGKSHPTIRRSATPTTEYMNSSDIPDFAADLSGSKAPPPRPPKPATLSRSKLEPEHASAAPSNDAYDLPKSTGERVTPSKSLEKQRRTASARVAPTPDPKTLPDLLDKTVEKPVLSSVERKTIDSYDFPATTKVHVIESDILDAPVALHPSARVEAGRHPYSNSAPGFKATKDSVFIYDYRPSLPTSNDDPLIHSPCDGATGDVSAVDRSPRTPNSGFSEVTPPAVDRNLKPRRKGSDSDTTASPTTPNPFRLKPAPDGKRQSSGTAAAVTRPRKPRVLPEGPELQYLDLDLDSDNSSPRTPNLVAADHQNSCSTLKDAAPYVPPNIVLTSSSSLPTSSPSSSSQSTVYKTVDFIKTDALNTLRSKVEEEHRNPQ